MPKYQVTLSDGRKFVVEANKPPTEAEVRSAMNAQASPEPGPASTAAPERGMLETVAKGAMDLGIGAFKKTGRFALGASDAIDGAFGTPTLAQISSRVNDMPEADVRRSLEATNTAQTVGGYAPEAAAAFASTPALLARMAAPVAARGGILPPIGRALMNYVVKPTAKTALGVAGTTGVGYGLDTATDGGLRRLITEMFLDGGKE